MWQERTMRTILLALVAVPQWGGLLVPSHAAVAARRGNADANSNTANKSVEFVNIIKDDLRRNNDDYVMPEERSQPEYNAPRAHPAPPAPPATRAPPAPPSPPAQHAPPAALPPRNLVLPPAQPPALRMQPSFGQPGSLPQQPRQPGPLPNQLGQARRHLEPLPHPPPHKLVMDPKRSLNLTKTHTYAAHNAGAHKSHTHSTHYKHLRINKLKGLLDKSKRAPAPSPNSPTPSPPPRLPPSPNDAMTTTEPTSSTARAPILRLFEQEQQQEPVMRQKPDKVTSPSPDELDMAPARGAEISHIRFKGRLCQRNLMNMEGPSYDKIGNEVNPAHHPSNSRGRRFYQTRPPKLVLPRCCNCCRKSVLGCQ